MDEQLVTTLRQLVGQYGAKAVVEALHHGVVANKGRGGWA